MSTTPVIITPSPEEEGQRLDHFIISASEMDMSRSFVQKLIKKDHILINGKPAKANSKVHAGDSVSITIPEPEKDTVEPRDIPLEILYEDTHLAVINKQAGITVHPGAGTHDDTLVNALLFHLDDLSSIGGVERPGIVHRLDRDTAGLMVIAKNDIAHRTLSEQFAARTIGKEYAAIVKGKPKAPHWAVDKPIGRHPVYRHKMTVTSNGRNALSEFSLIKMWHHSSGVFSLLKVVIHTGRTHQIRVHLSSEGLPIAGDPLYSRHTNSTDGLMLASVGLEFDHPATSERMKFSIPLPPHMQQFIDKLDAEG